MLKGKWICVNMRDRKKLKDLVDHHGNFDTVARLIGITESTLKKWMNKEEEVSFRSDAREKIKTLHTDKSLLPMRVAETVFSMVEIQERQLLIDLVELRDALNTILRLTRG